MSETVTFQIRHGTQDKEVFDQVFTNNQYRLPEKFPEDSVVVDIGANVGAFAAACIMRGAGTVVCFEAGQDNFLQLVANMAQFPGKAPCFNAAVWRSDKAEKIKFVDHGSNTACGAVLKATAEIEKNTVEVTAIGLDELLWHVTDGGKTRIHTVKIDAEGAEYPILYTCHCLHVIDRLLIETHEYPVKWKGHKFFVDGFPGDEACADGMGAFLNRNGFSFTRIKESDSNDINNLFFCERMK